jgi:hypothetical protein
MELSLGQCAHEYSSSFLQGYSGMRHWESWHLSYYVVAKFVQSLDLNLKLLFALGRKRQLRSTGVVVLSAIPPAPLLRVPTWLNTYFYNTMKSTRS